MSLTPMTADEIGLTVKEIDNLLSIARECQWEKSPAPPRATDDTTERSKGGPVANPTLDIVADERRLLLRAQVQRVERLLLGIAAATREAKRDLDAAITAWEGHDR